MTPPASVLCRMSGETIFITTGKPMSVAISGGFGGRFGHALFGNRNAVGVADELAFGGRQAGAFVRFGLIQNFADRIF